MRPGASSCLLSVADGGTAWTSWTMLEQGPRDGDDGDESRYSNMATWGPFDFHVLP